MSHNYHTPFKIEIDGWSHIPMIINKDRVMYLLELSVIYEDTKFGDPPHEDELSPEHFFEHSKSSCRISLDM